MLKAIRLTNFRKHPELSVEFSHGLQVVRGANESGKSTIAEACLYALYGATMLRTPLEETVTWGKKPSSLKVELDVEGQGKHYTYVRSGSGAEVICSGKVIVTGQKQVSDFSARLFGADGKMMQRLIFASQNGIRGALEEGPKAVAQHIESLCDFDIFDQIIERMQEKCVLGSPALAESRLAEAKTRLAGLTKPEPFDATEFQKKLDEGATLLKQKREYSDNLSEQNRVAITKLDDAEFLVRRYNDMAQKLSEQNEAQRATQRQIEAALLASKTLPDLKHLEALKHQVANLDSLQKQREVWTRLNRLSYPTLFWTDDKASFDTFVSKSQKTTTDLQEALHALDSKINQATAEAKATRAKIITTLTCPTCGQDIKNKDEIAAQNKRLEAEAVAVLQRVDDMKLEKAGVQKSVEDNQGILGELQAISRSASQFEQFAAAHGEFLNVDFNCVPPKLSWKGAVPSEGVNGDEIRQQIATLEAQLDAAKRAEGQVELLQASLKQQQEAIVSLDAEVKKFGDLPDVETLRSQQKSINFQSSEAISVVYRTEIELNALKEKFSELKANHDKLEKEYSDAVGAVARTEQELKDMYFNNTLLKKIRALRPQVADKLWSRVLAAVSVMFTRIRGEKSIVTKDKDGFKVNGQAVESLSGSTLDALGVAIRTALSRTFLPHCGFALMDEPGAACDADRVQSLIGFLASAGFDQTILITHDPVSESFADNLIELV